MIESTKCDYVMIGRGAMGNPYLFKQINEYLDNGTYETSSLKQKIGIFFEYLDIATKFKIRFSNIKGQAMSFTKGTDGATKLRAKITLSKNIKELESIMYQAYSQY